MKKWIWVLCGIILAWNMWLTLSIVSSDTESDTRISTGRYSVTGYTSDISKIVGNTASSLVRINGSGEGSGIIFSSQEGVVYIVTDSDLVSAEGTVTVTFDSGASLSGTLAAKDEGTKVAVISVVTDFDVTMFTKGNVSQLDAGSYIIGIEARNPSTGIMNVSYGVTSSVGTVRLSTRSLYRAQTFEIDCRMSGSSSGSAVTDAGGALLGMVTGVSNGKLQCVGLSDIQKVYEEVVEEGAVTRGSLSVSCTNVSSLRSYQKNERGLTLDLTEGVIINEVGGNAVNVLEVNDVIVSIEGTTISDVNALRDVYYTLTSGQEISVTVLRANENVTVSVIVE